jgi:hypothetical protein
VAEGRYYSEVLDRLGRFRAVTVAGLVMLVGLGACSSSSKSVSAQSATTPTTASAGATVPASTAAASTVPPTTVPASTTGAPASALAAGPCIVGAWTTTTFAQTTHGATTTGGAGIQLTITPSHISVNFSGMQPVNINAGSISGQGTYAGQESATASFPPSSSATSGSISFSNPGPSDVTFTAKLGGTSGAPIKVSNFPAGGISGTWTCSGAQMTLTVPTPDGPTTWDLARNT